MINRVRFHEEEMKGYYLEGGRLKVSQGRWQGMGVHCKRREYEKWYDDKRTGIQLRRVIWRGEGKLGQ